MCVLPLSHHHHGFTNITAAGEEEVGVKVTQSSEILSNPTAVAVHPNISGAREEAVAKAT